MRKLTALALLPFLATVSARADVIWQELFNYPNGQIIVTSTNAIPPTNAVWIRHSGSGNDAYVNNQRLEVSTTSAYLGIPANLTRADDVNRQFSLTNGSPYTNGQQVIYVSFIVNFTNLPTANGSYFAHFKYGSPGSSSFEGKFWALTGNPAQVTNNFTTLPNTFRLGVSATSSGSPSAVFGTDLALNTDYQVVLFWDPVTDDTLSLWVDPASFNDTKVESGANGDSFAPSTNNIANAFAFRQATGFGGFLTVSNLAVATTYNEAVTNVWPSNSVNPGIAYPLKAVTNYVEVPSQLSIVAAGQGLADFNYRWQKNGADFNNPNGNSNILPFPFPEVTDTGYYGVIVSNIFTGVTVTNPVALMWVTNGPPIIAVQPTNQQVYPGKTVTISVVAQGTPTLNYSWLFNGGAPTNANVDPTTTNTATLVINNVQSGNGTLGKYSCLIVNNYGSTNSFTNNLTLRTPQIVNIDTLRGMVDSTFFLPTNTSLYYTVTNAVVYTREVTNSSGAVNGGPFTAAPNAEFFMQDSSGGIAVFVAGGAGAQPRQGDIVTVTGPLGQFNNLLQFNLTSADASQSVTVTSHTDQLPAPMVLPFSFTNGSGAFVSVSNVIRHYEGLLVALTNVYFPANTVGSNFASGTYIITNLSGGGFNFYLNAANTNIIGQPIPAFAYSVTGPLGYYNSSLNTNRSSGFEIHPSSYSDIVTNAPAADVSVVKSGPGYVFAGNNLTYTIIISNAGPDLAGGVVATDSLPAGVAFVSASGGGANNGGLVTWPVGALAAGAASNLTVTVTAPASGSLTNTASAGSSTMDPNPANNTSLQVITAVAPLPLGTIAVASGTPAIRWTAQPSAPYSVWWSTNLSGPYAAIVTGLTFGNTAGAYTDSSANTNLPTGFYRISSP